MAVVEGEAGIGKTRLTEELFDRLRRGGARVLVGRSHEGESGLAYAPIVDALQARLRDGCDWLEQLPDRAVSEAARLVPDLAAGRTASPPLEGPGAEIRFLSGVWDTLVAALAGDRSGALLLDDLQWADDATLGLMSFGLRRLAEVPVLVVLAWRTPYDHPMRRSAAAGARAGSGAVVDLTRLARADVVELVRAARPELADPAVPQRLWETTEGVPLLLVEYLRTLGEEESWPLPTGARELLLPRLDPVGETARQLLSAAAVIGRSFDLGTVRAVSGRSDEETVSALEEVVRRGLVREGAGGVEHGRRPGDYDFGHEQLRALVYEQTSLARRRLLHGRARGGAGHPGRGGRTAPAARRPRGGGCCRLPARRRAGAGGVRQRGGSGPPERGAGARPPGPGRAAHRARRRADGARGLRGGTGQPGARRRSSGARGSSRGRAPARAAAPPAG